MRDSEKIHAGQTCHLVKASKDPCYSIIPLSREFVHGIRDDLGFQNSFLRWISICSLREMGYLLKKNVPILFRKERIRKSSSSYFYNG